MELEKIDVLNVTPLRDINCKLGILSRPDGSTFFCQGETAVMAGVYGPVETKQQKLLIDKANVEAHYRPKAGMPAVGDRLYECVIRNICETVLVAALYPRSAVLVIIQEMQNSGGLLSCAVNASCLALLDSGIDMRFLVAGIGCVVDEDGNLHVDPGPLQYTHTKATFDFVFDSVEGRVVALHTTGSYTLETYEEALQICRTASAQIFSYYKKIISQRYV